MKKFEFVSIQDIKRSNEKAGFHFFEPATMRFFASKIASKTVWGGCYFITSEQFSSASPRRYTVRKALPSGGIDTVGEFHSFETLRQAKSAIKSLLKEDK